MSFSVLCVSGALPHMALPGCGVGPIHPGFSSSRWASYARNASQLFRQALHGSLSGQSFTQGLFTPTTSFLAPYVPQTAVLAVGNMSVRSRTPQTQSRGCRPLSCCFHCPSVYPVCASLLWRTSSVTTRTMPRAFALDEFFAPFLATASNKKFSQMYRKKSMQIRKMQKKYLPAAFCPK